jgi:hypothetical protein
MGLFLLIQTMNPYLFCPCVACVIMGFVGTWKTSKDQGLELVLQQQPTELLLQNSSNSPGELLLAVASMTGCKPVVQLVFHFCSSSHFPLVSHF